MAKQVINNRDAYSLVRTKINSNFTEVYSNKQDLLVSGTNLKTVNGESLLGLGNVNISGGSSSYAIDVVENFGAVGDGVTDDTTAINNAIASLTDGDTLLFPNKTFLVNPQLTAITAPNVTIKGIPGAKIKTAKTSLYNIIFRVQSDNCTIEDIIFDQMDDSAQLPSAGTFQGCHTVFAQTFQSFTVRRCKFYTYGVTAILTQPADTYGTGTVLVEDCYAEFSRKVSTYYDVSVMNLDAMNVICRNNKVISVNGGVGSTLWYAESAYELHGPVITAINNEANYCNNHTLPVNWPMLYTTYDSTFRGAWEISSNYGHHLLRGINSWGAHTIASAVTRNFTFANNKFNLHATTNITPVLGIGFSNGNIDASFIKNGQIVNNVISFTYDTVSLDALYSGIPTSSIFGGVGAISFNTSNSCENILVQGNIIANFPGPSFNLICRQDHGTNVHKRIKIINNKIINPDFSTYFDLAEKGIFVLKDCDEIVIENNEFIKNSEITNNPKGLLGLGTGVTDVKFINNTFSDFVSGYRYGCDDGTSMSVVTTDNSIIRWYGGTKYENSLEVYTDTSDVPDGTYNIGDRVMYDGSISISKRGFKCSEAGTKRTIAAVTGTWANSTQIFVSPTTEIKAGDIVEFPGAQVSMVVYVSGSYIYTGSELTTWSGGQALALYEPVFDDII